jgi:vacuolar-type H+-ATPase subunit C/Vma6
MEMAMDLHTYAYSVTCLQETEIYVLDQRNYERLIEKRNPQVIEIIRKSVLEKYSLRMSWMQEKKDLPLFHIY